MRMLLLVLVLSSASSLERDVPHAIYQRFREIVDCIGHNDAKRLSGFVDYPLRREPPLPEITSPPAFVERYPILFDEAFRKKLSAYSDGDVFARNGAYGLVGGGFQGELWLDADGRIIALNYESAQERLERKRFEEDLRTRMYPTVRNWLENLVLARAGKLLVRIDVTRKGLRYVAWDGGRSMSERPDLILYDGREAFEGTMGGRRWTFSDGFRVYEVEDVCTGESETQLGLFLYILDDGLEQCRLRLVPCR